MTRRADPERILQARRAGIRNRLIGNTGMDLALAERWCDAWEAEAALRDLKRDGDYWEARQALGRRPVCRQEATALVKWMLLAATLFVAACGSTTATGKPTPEPPAFNVAAVQASFTEECSDPIIVDDLFCQQVRIGGMSADGTILNVPTGLNAASRDRAEEICAQIARAHFDGEGRDLGFEIVGVLDKDGGNAAACTVN